MQDHVRQPPYRWVILFSAAVMLALAMGQLINGLTVFFVPLEQEFGWARGDIALINSAGVIGLAVGGVVMGRLAETVAVRWLCLLGAVTFGLCMLIASRAGALWQFYVLFFLAGALGGGAFFAPLIALVGNWFVAGAGLALGIASAGQAVGQGGVPFVAALLIESFGWRDALAALGVVSLAVLTPLALLMRDPPLPAGRVSGGAAEEPEAPLPYGVVVPMVSLAVIGCCTLMSTPLMHLVPLMQGRGVSVADAGSVMFAMLTAGIAGRLFFGRLADTMGAIPAYVLASLWQTVMVFGFTRFDSLEGFYIYAPLYGFGYAGVMTGVLTTTRALTAPARRASAMGVIGAFAWLGHAIGGWQGGFLFDLTGDYTLPFAVAAGAGVFNLAVMATLVLTLRRGARVAVG